MTELTCKTWRAHRNFLERLKCYEKIYETKLTDGSEQLAAEAEHARNRYAKPSATG